MHPWQHGLYLSPVMSAISPFAFLACPALSLAIGVIIYISKVNDEVSHRKKPETDEDEGFRYSYGWAFFFAGASFITSMVAAVTNISLYLRRYSSIKDMMLIIPGLEKQGHVDLTRCVHDEESDFGVGTNYGSGKFSTSTSGGFSSYRGLGSIAQSPTIILWGLLSPCLLYTCLWLTCLLRMTPKRQTTPSSFVYSRRYFTEMPPGHFFEAIRDCNDLSFLLGVSRFQQVTFHESHWGNNLTCNLQSLLYFYIITCHLHLCEVGVP